jgi:hypothetical protein
MRLEHSFFYHKSKANLLKSKANLLWEAYKARLGTSEFDAIHVDLGSLLHAHQDLSCLEEPFTREEIDDVVTDLLSDKYPGPGGFNTDFIKKCWHIIKEDFCKLVEDFYQGSLTVQSINGS